MSAKERLDKFKNKWEEIEYNGFFLRRYIEKQKRCRRAVKWCLKYSPMVIYMVEALESNGCPVDRKRHFVCEPCSSAVRGGYDAKHNQIVVCENVNQDPCTTMFHELIHMFDYCRANMDYTNLDHLACTEIRAASLSDCQFGPSWWHGGKSFLEMEKQHENCVKRVASMSVQIARNVSEKEARQAVDKVFTKCYNDMEPVGRVPKNYSSKDWNCVHNEGYMYGYVPWRPGIPKKSSSE